MFKNKSIIVFIYLISLFFCSFCHSQSNLDFELSNIGWTNKDNSKNFQMIKGNVIPTFRIRPIIKDSIGGDYWRGIPHSIGHHGNYWLSSSGEYTSDTNSTQGDLLTGIIVSDEFLIQSDKLYFLVGGTGGSVELMVKIQSWEHSISSDIIIEDFNYEIAEVINPDGIEVMTRKFFKTDSLIGKTARVKISDQDISSHINVDDFILNKDTVINDSILNYKFRTNYTNNLSDFTSLSFFKTRDLILPMWGFVDTHGHWMNNVGFGGDLLLGKPDGNIEIALRDCKNIHGLNGLGFGNISDGKSFLISAISEGNRIPGHITSGYPDFNGWPSFRSIIHQVMYVDWVRRAYLGGLRLIVCPMGNNKELAKIMGNLTRKQDYSDTLAIKNEVEYIKVMINKLKIEGWIDIAYSSEDVKRLNMENKLAIVLGIEVDQLGGFLYLDNKDLKKNKDSINNYINYIYNTLGIRHLFPVHHADNAFGGFSLYGSEDFSINNYSLKKNIKAIPNYEKYVKVDSSSLVSFRLGNMDFLSRQYLSKIFTGYNPPGYKGIFCGDYYGNIFKSRGHINKLGLTSNGNILIDLLLEYGIIIDVDHMSMNTTDDLLNYLDTTKKILGNDTIYYNKYPLLAGHTNFLNQKFDINETSDCEPCKIKIKDEHAKTDEMIRKIMEKGGFVSPITEGDNDIKANIFEYENPGSSKSWLEAFIYAIKIMKNKGVGFGTDMNGFVGQLCPRFGTYSAYAIRDDKVRQNSIGSRKYLALNQENGVMYDNNLKDCRSHKFAGNDVFDETEKEIWQAIFAAHSNYEFSFLSKYQEKLIKGIRFAIDSSIIVNPNIKNFNETEASSYILAKRYECIENVDIEKFIKTNKLNRKNLFEKLNEIDSIYLNYISLKGNNIPLKRYGIITKNGVRDFDFNIDGLAHYGLFPDFIQDLKNIGLSNDQMSVLFNSARDFAEMMGKCEDISKKLIRIEK